MGLEGVGGHVWEDSLGRPEAWPYYYKWKGSVVEEATSASKEAMEFHNRFMSIGRPLYFVCKIHNVNH